MKDFTQKGLKTFKKNLNIDLSKLKDEELSKLYKKYEFNLNEIELIFSNLSSNKQTVALKAKNILIPKRLKLKTYIAKRNILQSLMVNNGIFSQQDVNTLCNKLVELVPMSVFKEALTTITGNFKIKKELPVTTMRNIEQTMDGYKVIFYKGNKTSEKPIVNKLFTNKTYGNGTLGIAKTWRDKKEFQLIKNGDIVIKRFPYKRSSGTKIVGVNLLENKYWKAAWTENDEQKQKTFSIREYGRKEAKNKAVKLRKVKEKMMLKDYISYLKNYGLSDKVVDYFLQKYR